MFIKNIYKNKKNFSQKSLLNLIVIYLIIGALFGSIIANKINNQTYNKINSQIKYFLHTINKNNITCENRLDIFLSEFFKDAKIVLFLWLMAFIPVGRFFIALILFFKSFTYGFTSSVLFDVYKINGLIYAFKYILMQNIILLPIFVFISFCSLNYISIKQDKKNKLNTTKTSIDLEYFLTLALSLACVFLSLLIEIYFFIN
jgi:stage II sporulation protein M